MTVVIKTYLTVRFGARWFFFAQQNQWDLSNYDTFDMKSLGEDSYRDLSGIGIPVAKKCKALARDSLSLLAYVK
ncbi:Uncharacterised protein [Salmonella enterica subsp. arizonae]|uniref:Uncharacterized protein n=1 Tax=Salmonella enterica subsp. arizonae TaxID=59203 RepID=A0A2X4TID4_SALER|nr:Uncharacterised protein [Salmonella enterica subsp. arizonae]